MARIVGITGGHGAGTPKVFEHLNTVTIPALTVKNVHVDNTDLDLYLQQHWSVNIPIVWSNALFATEFYTELLKLRVDYDASQLRPLYDKEHRIFINRTPVDIYAYMRILTERLDIAIQYFRFFERSCIQAMNPYDKVLFMPLDVVPFDPEPQRENRAIQVLHHNYTLEFLQAYMPRDRWAVISANTPASRAEQMLAVTEHLKTESDPQAPLQFPVLPPLEPLPGTITPPPPPAPVGTPPSPVGAPAPVGAPVGSPAPVGEPVGEPVGTPVGTPAPVGEPVGAPAPVGSPSPSPTGPTPVGTPPSPPPVITNPQFTPTPTAVPTEVQQLPATLTNGTVLTLERGRAYRGPLNLDGRSNIVINAALGSEPMPIITVGEAITGFVKHTGSIWKAPIAFTPEQVCVDMIPMDAAFWPSNTHWATGNGGETSITGVTIPNGDVNGARCVIQTHPWNLESRRVLGYSSGNLQLSGSIDADVYRGFNPSGPTNFYLEGKLWMLSKSNQWAVDNGFLYVWCADNKTPEGRIWVNRGEDAISAQNSNNIQIRGVKIAGAHVGVDGRGSKDLRIEDCDLQCFSKIPVFINSAQRVTVQHSAITYARYSGIDARWDDNVVTVRLCTIANIGTHFTKPDHIQGALNSPIGIGWTVEDNVISSCGYIGIRVYRNAKVLRNTVDGWCTRMQDGGGIYVNNHQKGTDMNTLIQNNVVKNGTRGASNYSIYLDDNTKSVQVYDNIVEDNNACTAFFLHNASNCDIRRNKFRMMAGHDNMTLGFADNYNDGYFRNNSFADNEVVAPLGVRPIFISGGSLVSMVAFSNNRYYTQESFANLEGVGFLSWEQWRSQFGESGSIRQDPEFAPPLYGEPPPVAVGSPAPVGASTGSPGTVATQVRYIRDYINGSDKNSANHWVEIQAINFNNQNAALNKNVTISAINSEYSAPLSAIVDGNTESDPYVHAPSGMQWVQIDLGTILDISHVQVWHYWADARVYNDSRTEVSIDGVNWRVIHSQPYTETSLGRTSYVADGTVVPVGSPIPVGEPVGTPPAPVGTPPAPVGTPAPVGEPVGTPPAPVGEPVGSPSPSPSPAPVVFEATLFSAPAAGATVNGIINLEVRGSNLGNVELLPPDGYLPVYGRFTVNEDRTAAVLAFNTASIADGQWIFRILAFDQPPGVASANELTPMASRIWTFKNNISVGTPGTPVPVGSPSPSGSGPVGQNANDWVLTFEDHFNGPGLDRTKWTERGGPRTLVSTPGTWKIENSNLVMCYQDPFQRGNCTFITDPSGRDIQGGFQQTYGYFEARIKLPRGEKAFPAFWLFRNDEREIDIMENFGGSGATWHTNDWRPINAAWTVHRTHTDNSLISGNLAHDYYKQYPGNINYPWLAVNVLDLSVDYHVYALRWEPGAMYFYFDGRPWRAQNGSGFPWTARAGEFNVPMYMMLDFWIDSHTTAGSMPRGFGAHEMRVDYVRAWRRR